MRTFIAVPLTPECLALLEQMQCELRACNADVRWVNIPSIHLTLKFLGEIEPEIIPELAESLEEASRSESSFTLTLRGLGCFPSLRNPRVVWCGAEGDIDCLLRLQQKVENVCATMGFAPEERVFRPHLTLGRVNGKRNLQPLIACIKMGSVQQRSLKIHNFNIYRSVLKPKGAEYTILKTIRLQDQENHDN